MVRGETRSKFATSLIVNRSGKSESDTLLLEYDMVCGIISEFFEFVKWGRCNVESGADESYSNNSLKDVGDCGL